MKKVPCVFIDCSNNEQVEWWNNIGRLLVKAVEYDKVVETATGKTVGVIFCITGLLSKIVINKANSFHKNATEMEL